MNEDPGLLLLQLLCERDGQPLARLAKQLRLSQSELARVLTELDDAPTHAGLGVLQRRESAGRICVWLTDKGRVLCAP